MQVVLLLGQVGDLFVEVGFGGGDILEVLFESFAFFLAFEDGLAVDGGLGGGGLALFLQLVMGPLEFLVGVLQFLMDGAEAGVALGLIGEGASEDRGPGGFGGCGDPGEDNGGWELGAVLSPGHDVEGIALGAGAGGLAFEEETAEMIVKTAFEEDADVLADELLPAEHGGAEIA